MTTKTLICVLFILSVLSCNSKSDTLSTTAHSSKYKKNEPISINSPKLNGNQAMVIAKVKSDSFLSNFFGKDKFKKHLVCDKKISYINCEIQNQTEIFHFDDSINCMPHLFELEYYILVGSDTIWAFDIGSDSSMTFKFPPIDYWEGKFRAYRFLLNDKFKISFTKAKNIGRKHGFEEEEYKIELYHKNEEDLNLNSSYFWRIEPKKMVLNEVAKAIEIDPLTGKVNEIEIGVISAH